MKFLLTDDDILNANSLLTDISKEAKYFFGFYLLKTDTLGNVYRFVLINLRNVFYKNLTELLNEGFSENDIIETIISQTCNTITHEGIHCALGNDNFSQSRECNDYIIDKLMEV